MIKDSDFIKLLVFCVLVTFSVISCQTDGHESSAPDSFQIPDNFQLELVASEPLVADPVDMAIDEHGTMMVVEMHGYPLDVSGSGVIKQLIDTDADGQVDQATVFADGLVLPTGIMKWKEGWLVTDPPNVLYLEDTTHDGAADVRDTLLVGFARSNPQHNVNSPTYGLDNWIYLSHEGSIQTKLFNELLGDEGEQVHYIHKADGPMLPRNADGLGVRFKPDSYELESLSSRGQFGQAFDDWGQHFLTSNADHLYHKVLDADYVNRNENLLVSSSRHYMPSSGKGFDIYPITTSPEHQLLTDMGVITSACGILWYNGGLFDAEYANTIFTAEPVHNLIHVDKIVDDGATFSSENFFSDREFLASTDSWFRPVNHYIGPDGAVYILDYYRKIIEHPEWLSDEITQSDDLTAGTDMGRIYRLSPKGTKPMDFIGQMGLADYSIDQLIQSLAHKNIWWRNHAQRLIMDRQDPVSIDLLVDFVKQTNSAQAKVHAAWLLDAMDHVDLNVMETLLNDPHPGVRKNMIKIAEAHLERKPDILEDLLALVDDEDAKVRFQLLLTLGDLKDPESVAVRQSILKKDISDPWVQLAALSASNVDVDNLYQWASHELMSLESVETANLFERLAQMIVRSSPDEKINAFISDLFSQNYDSWYSVAVLQSLGDALDTKNEFVLTANNQLLLAQRLSTEKREANRETLIDLMASTHYFDSDRNDLVQQSIGVLESSHNHNEYSVFEAINIIGKSRPENHIDLLSQTFSQHKSERVKMASLKALIAADDFEVAQLFKHKWPLFSIEERREAMLFLLKNDANRLLLLNSIKDNSIQSSSLSWPQTVSLLNSSNPEIRPLARSLLEGSQLKADDVWAHFEPCLSMEGDMQLGADVFKLNCGTCHQLGNEYGIAFGPDLAPVQNRNKASLLLDILQPNRAIADGFELWMIDLHSGNQIAGVISEEGPNSVTILDATGNEQVISRSEIDAMKAAELSAMPEGLHTQLTINEMADLLAFLKEV